MATAGTPLLWRRDRLVWRTVRMALISRRRRAMRLLIRRRSVSSLVSPGPRVPTPPPAPPPRATPATPAPPAPGAAALPRERLAPAAQTRQKVLQLGQLDLRLALFAL